VSLAIRKIDYREKEELKRAVAIQEEAWGFSSPLDVVPLPIFILSAKYGGLVLGAYREARMVGFSLAFPLVEGGHTVLHSHMTAVRPREQNSGVGLQIKLFQRREAQKMGYRTITWTFDPLQCRNAYFNFHKLGVRVGEYLSDFYGEMSSRMSAGVPTHRLLVHWSVEEMERKPCPTPEVVIFQGGPGDFSLPRKSWIGLKIPRDINSLPRKEALAWYSAVDRAMPLLLENYEIMDFERENCTYILKRK